MLCKRYSSDLSSHLRNLYENKLKNFNIMDPYEIPFFECEEDVHKWPEIEHGDIVNYLVFSTHSITHNEMKSYKSLEAHNYYTSGWVNNRVFIKVLAEDRALLLGEVKHSQSVRASPLKVWLLCKKDGEILTGHCNCMAGIGEACSHIGAFLFFLEAGIRLKKDESCTDRKNVWLQPHIKDVEFAQIKDIDFQSASMKVKTASEKRPKKQKIMPSSVPVPEPSDDEIHQFFTNLDTAGLSSAVLTVVEPFNNKFISEEDTIKKLTNLYSSEHKKLAWQQLFDKCQEISKKLVVTKSDAEKIEKVQRRNIKIKSGSFIELDV